MEKRLAPLFNLRADRGRCFYLYGNAAYTRSLVMESPHDRGRFILSTVNRVSIDYSKYQ